MRLSIVVPAFNEEKRIYKILDAILGYFKDKPGYTYEVLVVDDGSTDKTADVVRERMKSWPNLKSLSYGVNKGKGYAVRYAMLRAKGDIRMFSDADNSTPFEEIDKFIPLLEDGLCDVAIGSRSMDESKVIVAQSWIKTFAGRLGKDFANILLGLDIKDTQCGFKCFTADTVRALFPKIKQDGWSFDMEFLFLAKRHGLKVKEVPVRWINDTDSRVKPLDYIKVLMQVFRIRFDHLFNS